MKLKKCHQCGKEFYGYKHGNLVNAYCSRKCFAYNFMSKRPKVKCKFCGTVFIIESGRKRSAEFCNRKCRQMHSVGTIRVDPEIVGKVRSLVESGYSFRKVSSELGVSRETISKIMSSKMRNAISEISRGIFNVTGEGSNVISDPKELMEIFRQTTNGAVFFTGSIQGKKHEVSIC